MKLLVPFVCGMVFALGLGISGMTNADTVLAFLNLAGTWDPTLAFVMVGAIGAHRLVYGPIMRRASPVLESTFHLPTATEMDRPLLAGAALFGLGWGLSGYCPGPAVVSTVTGAPEAITFAVAMIAGMALHRALGHGSTTDG
jgi:uncharacterized membrane protein YedE/YeeE